MNKTVTLAEAVASGRRFRYAYGNITSWGHRARTGHVWMSAENTYRASTGFHPEGIRCSVCGEGNLGLNKGATDAWILERTEDEFEGAALEIINGLGLTVRQAEKV